MNGRALPRFARFSPADEIRSNVFRPSVSRFSALSAVSLRKINQLSSKSPAEESSSRGNRLNILIFNRSADDHAARPGVRYSPDSSQQKRCAAMRFSIEIIVSLILSFYLTLKMPFLHRYHCERNSCLALSSAITIRYDFQRNG